MKNLILLFLFVNFVSLSYGQKTHLVTGISIFQIGSTKEKLLHDLDSLHYKGPIDEPAYKLTKYYSEQLKSGNIVYKGKLSVDTVNLNPDKVYDTKLYLEMEMLNPNVEKYFIKNFEITDDIKLENVELFFYNGQLEYFTIDNNKKVRDALDLKYGEANSTLKEKEINCTYTYTGASIVKKDYEITYTWDNPNGIQIKDYQHLYYNDKCEAQVIILFTVSKNQQSFNLTSSQTYYKNFLDYKKSVNDTKKKSALDKF